MSLTSLLPSLARPPSLACTHACTRTHISPSATLTAMPTQKPREGSRVTILFFSHIQEVLKAQGHPCGKTFGTPETFGMTHRSRGQHRTQPSEVSPPCLLKGAVFSRLALIQRKGFISTRLKGFRFQPTIQPFSSATFWLETGRHTCSPK